MKAKDVLEHFLSRADWVNREKTVDRIIAGNPEKDVDRCIVTWMASFRALRTMADRGISLMVCHEPTFWNHRDNRPTPDAAEAQKRKFIAEHGIVIIRNHCCWDRWPEVGIPWAWAKFLGLTGRPVRIGANGYQHRYDVEPTTLAAFARAMAARCASIGEPMVQVTGDGGARVSKIGVGTGCGCNVETYVEMGCDCSIVCDDGSCYWAGIQRADDLGHPVIRVNHGTSEEPGMAALTRYINENLPLKAEHLPHGSTFRLVG